MRAITTGDRCGSRTRQQHSPATDPRAPRPSRPGITECVTEPLTATNDIPGQLRRAAGRRRGTRPARATDYRSGRPSPQDRPRCGTGPVSYTHLRAHETDSYLVC